MVNKPKIDRAKVAAALTNYCTKCGHAIPPDKIQRIDFERMVCPNCGERFTPGVLRGLPGL